MTALPHCRWCGKAPHGGEWCPLVRAIEYHQSPVDEFGNKWPPLSVKRVEFHSPQPIKWGPSYCECAPDQCLMLTNCRKGRIRA